MSEEYTAEAPGDAAAYHAKYVGVLGVRFVPTDQELIVYYLGRKLRNEPLPTDLVVDGHDAYAEHPKKLVPKLGESIEGAWYLFSPRDRRYASGMRPKRDTDDGEGRWKAMEAEKLVLGGADGKEVIGAKRALTFHEHSHQVDAQGKRKRVISKSKPTEWKMVEFVFSNSSRAARDDTAPDPMLLNECVLCKITNKSLRSANWDAQGEEEEENDDNNGEEEPTPDGGCESQKQRLPKQQPAGGGGAGAQGEQQQPPPRGGAGLHGSRQPARAEAPSGQHMAALPGDDNRGAKYFVGVDGSNRSGATRLSVFGSDHHIGAFHGGGAGSRGNQQPATAEVPSGQHMAALPGDGYSGAKYFVGVDGSNRCGNNRLSVFGSDDHIGAFYGSGAGSHGNWQPATAEAPSGLHMAALPGGGAKYFVGVDGSNRSGTTMLSAFSSDAHIGAFYGGGAGSHGNQQPATAEAPSGQHMAALPVDGYRGAKYFVGVDGSNRCGNNRLSVLGSDDHIGAFYGSGAGSHGNWQPATAEAPSGLHMAALPGGGAKYFVGVDGSNRSGTTMLSAFSSDAHIGAFYGGGAGSHGNQQPATAEAPSGLHMAALPGDDYRGAKYFVGDDGSNRSGTNRLSVFDSDNNIGAFYGSGDSLGTQRAGHRQQASSGGAGSWPYEQQLPTPEAPNRGGAVATDAAAQQSDADMCY